MSIDEDLFLRTESLKGFGCGEGERKKVGGSESGEESQEWLKEAIDSWEREEMVSHFSLELCIFT